MIHWLLDLTHEAVSKAESFKVTGVNERRFLFLHTWQSSNRFAGLVSAEELHNSDLRRVTGEKPFSAIGWQTPWAQVLRGFESWDSNSTSKVRTYYLCILETIVLKAAWMSAEEHVQTTGKVCFCKMSDRYWGENRTFYSPFWHGLWREGNLPSPAL